MITIGLSAHRVETIPFLKDIMAVQDAVILEEPSHPSFQTMLDEKVSVPDYVRTTEPSFPIYSEKVYPLLQRYHKEGKLVIQIEPYLEKLNEMQAWIEEGLKPTEQVLQPEMKAVYESENLTFGALLHYYQSLNRPFEEITQAVTDFASRDARRIRLRDEMRAEAIIDFIRKNGLEDKSIYVEAGYIHFALRPSLLWKQEAWRHKVRQVLILARPCRHLSYRQWGRAVDFILPPGDLLTLHHIFRGEINSTLGRLLAARSLIYVSLLTKDELLPTDEEPTPHLAEEIRLKAFVDKLSYEACERLFERIKTTPASEAKKIAGLPPVEPSR